MKWYIKVGAVALVFIIVIAVGINYLNGVRYENEIAEIKASRNTALDSYNENKNLVTSYLQVYEIRNESSYQSIKNVLYDSFSKEMQKELFPSVNYSGVDLHTMSTKLIRCIGTNYPKNQTNTFLLEYNLTGVNYNQDITNLVEVKDGVICRIERIK